MRAGAELRFKSDSCGFRRARVLPTFPGIYGIFFLIILAISPVIATHRAEAQTPAAAPVQQDVPRDAADKPAGGPTAVEQPATATTPAVPAPGSVAPAAKPGEPAAVPAGVAQPVSGESVQGTGSSLIPHDLSPYGMFMNADIVVKVVMVGLGFASLVTWTILLVKFLELSAARAVARRGVDSLAGSGSLTEGAGLLKKPQAPVTRLARAAMDEAERSQGLPAEGVKERAAALLSRIEARAGRAMTRGTGLLATIGSTAPFVGLFGTVWGIMNSFIGISKTNTTNLAVVAPGIAEALLATACGLVAAIPAVIIYNMFARGITGYRQVLGDASTEVLRLLSRDLDREAGPNGAVAMPRRAAE